MTIEETVHDEEYCTNATYLGEVLDEEQQILQTQFTGAKTDPFGRLLVSLYGYTIEGNEFFFIYVDGVYGMYGVDQQIIEDGASYEFKLGTY